MGEIFSLQRDNLTFEGELIATAASTDDPQSSDFSGSTGRWTELALYKTTVGGTWVCSRIGRSCWQGERDSHEATQCKTEQELIDWFGTDWLAKRLLKSAGIDSAEHID